ncbi:MAG: chromosomal replication initiator protein DnaA [Myxococcota bacterium]
MENLWESALREIRGRLSSENFETWIEPIRFVSIEEDQVRLRVPNRFYEEWLSTHYVDVILEAIRLHGDGLLSEQLNYEEPGNSSALPEDLKLQWVVDEGLQREIEHIRNTERIADEQASKASTGSKTAVQQPHADLNPKYNFDNFVVGPSNQLAHAASVACGSSPGQRYNPLFIYGGVGLGKTHLVNALGHTITASNNKVRILYLSAEQFTNEFIWALKNHRISEFREQYRSRCDVLLMDDIQFLAGREQTQEEFFHTFNALYHLDRQIVVTSDVYPQQIQEMEERLISRFQSGMVADIQAPELDTRIAILQQKAEQESIELLPDVALFLAQVVKSNVRELEGTLIRIAVKADLLNRPIDLELAQETMQVSKTSPDKAIGVDDIQRTVCDYFGIRMADLKGRRRHRAVSFPRALAMYVSRSRLGCSFPDLGDRFGGKDHTTVMSAYRKISRLVKEDSKVRQDVEAIERKLGF